jgi:hypothetical protein
MRSSMWRTKTTTVSFGQSLPLCIQEITTPTEFVSIRPMQQSSILMEYLSQWEWQIYRNLKSRIKYMSTCLDVRRDMSFPSTSQHIDTINTYTCSWRQTSKNLISVGSKT